MATEQEILRAIAIMTAAYPAFDPKPETIEVYVVLLQDLPGNVLMAAVQQCIADCRFFPTVAEIREKARSIGTSAYIPSSTEAWEEVMEQVRSVGYIGRPSFHNYITERVVASIGWREICTSENVVADRAHFMRMYDELAERSERYNSLIPQVRAMIDGQRAEMLEACTAGIVRKLAEKLTVR